MTTKPTPREAHLESLVASLKDKERINAEEHAHLLRKYWAIIKQLETLSAQVEKVREPYQSVLIP